MLCLAAYEWIVPDVFYYSPKGGIPCVSEPYFMNTIFLISRPILKNLKRYQYQLVTSGSILKNLKRYQHQLLTSRSILKNLIWYLFTTMCGSNSIQSKIARFEEEQLEIRLGKEFDNESVEFPLLHLHLKHCRNIG